MYTWLDIGGNSYGCIRQTDKKLIFVMRFKRWLTASEQIDKAPKCLIVVEDIKDKASVRKIWEPDYKNYGDGNFK